MPAEHKAAQRTEPLPNYMPALPPAPSEMTGCDAVFPGYGFLSESTEFSALCEDNGIAFIGPTAGALLRLE